VLCARDHKLLHIFRDLAIQQLRHGAAIFPVESLTRIGNPALRGRSAPESDVGRRGPGDRPG
jgi:hypothetical protein